MLSAVSGRSTFHCLLQIPGSGGPVIGRKGTLAGGTMHGFGQGIQQKTAGILGRIPSNNITILSDQRKQHFGNTLKMEQNEAIKRISKIVKKGSILSVLPFCDRKVCNQWILLISLF